MRILPVFILIIALMGCETYRMGGISKTLLGNYIAYCSEENEATRAGLLATIKANDPGYQEHIVCPEKP